MSKSTHSNCLFDRFESSRRELSLMEQHRELRQAATKAFQQSLDQLQQTLEAAETNYSTTKETVANHPAKPVKPPPKPAARFDMKSFEQAVADIDQFFERQQGSSTD